ncbi:MAG: mannose-6-phosphate isomerase, class I [Actinophytocola sp.]|nr:mannose-6-phosphate isomerase, class I [Actinophytocola sp.]
MELLHNAVRPYAWGSRTAIAELLGRPVPAPHPEAELWMGAHPGDPSRVSCPEGRLRSLCEVVADDPDGQLGSGCARRWQNRLPFLLKVLAADEPLSMQAHPTAAQAADGFAREEAAGIPRDAPERNYPDPTAKPELVCALTEFEVLSGFADAARTVRLLRTIETPELTAYTDLLAEQPDTDGLRALFTTWITLPQQRIDDLLPDVLKSCARHAEAHGEFAAECATVVQLGDEHPHDAGVLTSLLLNRIELRAGEALYLPAGNLHLYLRGFAVEILANSDNILRGGLTPKHVDVPELLRVIDFSRGSVPVLSDEPDSADPRLRVYRTDAPEFELSRMDWPDGDTSPVELPAGPQILLCTRGGAVLRESATGRELALARGESAWLAARDGAVTVRPSAATSPQLFRATAGPAG